MSGKADSMKARTIVRRSITMLYNKLVGQVDILNSQQRSMNIMKATGLLDQIKQLDTDCFNENIENEAADADLQNDAEVSEQYTDKLYEILSLLEQPIAETNDSNALHRNYSNTQRMKLPAIELPKYGHEKGENLRKFFVIFDSILEKSDHLSQHQQFLLLRGQLSGAPRILVDTLDFDLHTYQAAKEALLAAFDSTDKSKEDMIQMLVDLKLKENEEPYNFIGQFRTICSAVKSLKLEVDDFVRYFIWKGLNRDFQNIFTSMTNKSRPSLKEISDNIFEAADRYNTHISQSKPDTGRSRSAAYQKTASNAVAVKDMDVTAVNIEQKSKTFCGLCKADKKPYEHYIGKCPEYIDAKTKVAKLRKIDGCIKCGFSNHNSSKCKLKFQSKCRKCQGDHFTFLCFRDLKKPGSTSTKRYVWTRRKLQCPHVSRRTQYPRKILLFYRHLPVMCKLEKTLLNHCVFLRMVGPRSPS